MGEIFPNPTVKEVIFQIKFSNLLFIEQKMGNYQLEIMETFPDSQEVIEQQIMFAITDDDTKREEVKGTPFNKIWQFISPEGDTLAITSNSLSLVSKKHKTYKEKEGEHKLRDIIEKSVNSFLDKVAPISIIKRMGLRYKDECPLPEDLTNDSYRSYYNTTFGFSRFNISDASEMMFVTNVRRDKEINLRYVESYKEAEKKLGLDFDAYKFKVEPKNYLSDLDELYSVVHEAWENTIKEPVKEYMRKPKGE